MAKSSENWLLGIVIALGFFFLILVLGFVLKGVVESSKTPGGWFGPKEVVVKKGDYSMQQAYAVCKAKVRSLDYLDFQSLRLDSKSSRFDEESNQFMIFLDVDIMRDGKIEGEFARCYVSSLDNTLAEFRLKGNNSLFGKFK